MPTFVLIEDNADHAELMAHSLRGAEAEFRHFDNGADALSHLEKLSNGERAEVSAVLLDLKLGREHGLDVLQEIRARGWMLPVVVLTTSDQSADREQAYAHQANSYLVKPLRFDEFRAMVEEVRRYWGEFNRPG